MRLGFEAHGGFFLRVAIAAGGELAGVMERRLDCRDLRLPFIFHRHGRPIGDIRKSWRTACKAAGLAGTLPYDLRRSGVKHIVESGVDVHSAMQFSGHRTSAMLRRYHIVDVGDLRRAAEKASAYSGEVSRVVSLTDERSRR